MKQTLFLLFSFCLTSLMSCQKKQYASFQNGFAPQETHNSEKTEVKTVEIDLRIIVVPKSGINKYFIVKDLVNYFVFRILA